jgi:hypothetical protein
MNFYVFGKLIVMKSSSPAISIPHEKENAIQHFLADTFHDAKSHINDGLNALKKELIGIGESTFDLFSMPVNNFLKNIDQIERDFLNGLERSRNQSALRIVTVEQALSDTIQLEENY